MGEQKANIIECLKTRFKNCDRVEPQDDNCYYYIVLTMIIVKREGGIAPWDKLQLIQNKNKKKT